jgi:zinc transporter 1
MSKSELENVEQKPWYKDKTALKIIVVIIMTGVFFLVELIVGIVTRSVALLSDAVHMLSDLLSLIIGYAFLQVLYKYIFNKILKISKRSKSSEMTFGWNRSEVLGAFLNSTLLICLVFLILMEGFFFSFFSFYYFQYSYKEICW